MVRVLTVALIFAALATAQAKRTQPKLIKTVPVDYSEEARKANVSGAVKLDVTIGTDGHVLRTHIARDVGFGLDEKCEESVRKWTFKPAEEDGEPVVATVPIECTFVLPRNK